MSLTPPPLPSPCNNDGQLQLPSLSTSPPPSFPPPSSPSPQLITTHTGPVYCVAVHPTDTMICSVGDDGFVRVWECRPPTIPSADGGDEEDDEDDDDDDSNGEFEVIYSMSRSGMYRHIHMFVTYIRKYLR